MSPREPFVVVRVGTQELAPELTRHILLVRITMREDKADSGTLTIRDADGSVFDSKIFDRGRRLTLIMGWADALEPRGPYVIKSAKPDFPEAGEPRLQVTFQDLSHAMNKKQKRRRFRDLTPIQIVKQIASEHGLGYDLEDVETVRFTDDVPLVQANITDAKLLQRLAARYGFVWGVEGSTLYFRRPADLDQLNQQGNVPVLSYRMNDYSLRSFQPEVKVQKKRKRKKAKQKQSNIDLTTGKAFSLDQIRQDVVDAVPSMGAVVNTLAGEEGQSGKVDTDTSSPGVEKKRELGFVNSLTGAISYGFKDTAGEEAGDEPDEESEPGDESGSATPSTEEEARARGAAKVTRASELVEAQCVLRLASMRWRPGDKCIVAGVGERLSGRYRVTELTQEVSNSTTFKTTLKLAKRTFLPDTGAKSRIANAERAASSGETPGDRSPSNATSAPAATTAREETVGVIDSVRGTTKIVTRRINGQED